MICPLTFDSECGSASEEVLLAMLPFESELPNEFVAEKGAEPEEANDDVDFRC